MKTRRQFNTRAAALAAMAAGGPLAARRALAQAVPVPAYQPFKPGQRGGGGVLRLLMWQGPTLLNPHFAVGAKDHEGCALFYEALLRFDVNGQPVPVLAAQIPTRANGGIAADGRSVTWKLRPGVTWHDGRPFTADDVVFNWRFATDRDSAAITGGQYDGVKAVEKVDALTVRVVFVRPTALWTRGASVLQVPRHLFEPYLGARSREAPANLKPVGTGPYLCADFKPADLVRGTLNTAYHQPARPFFDSVEMKGGGDSASAARAVLQTGEYDFGWNIQLEDEVLRRMEASGKGRAVFSPSGDTEMILLNAADPWTPLEGERAHPKSRHPILSEHAVRQALALLLDRQGIQQAVYGRGGVVTANVINNPPALNSPNTRHEFSLDKAQALLDGAGWKRGADGIRSKDGRRLKLVFQTTVNPVRQKVQQVFKQACARAGIELELKAVVASVFFSSDEGNPDTASKFWADLEMFANSGREPDPWTFLQWFASWQVASKANKWQGFNRSRWTHPEFDRLLRAAETEADTARRNDMFIRMNDLVASEVAAIPLVYRPSVNVLGRGLVASVSGWDTALSSVADWYREG